MDGSSQSEVSLTPQAAGEINRGAAMLSVAAASLLVALKGGAWIASGSIAMLASLADSMLDLVASLFTYFAVRFAATPPDREHRFGHGKAESFAGLFQAGLVAVSGALIAVEAVRRFADPQPVERAGLAIMVMMVSIVVTGALIFYQSRAVAQTGSVAVSGDRAHYAADLAANVAVMIGIGAAALWQWEWADAIAGLLVAAWLGWGALHVAGESADQLMDRELPDEARARIKTLALADGDILGVHSLRTRASGPMLHIQFHADLDPNLSLRRAHEIIVAAETRIRAAFPAADVLIHPDPHDAAEPHGLFPEGREDAH